MADRDIAAVATSTGRFLDFFDLGSGDHLGRIDDLIAEPHEMVLDSRRGTLVVTHSYREGFYGGDQEKGSELSVIDVRNRKVLDVIDLAPFAGPHDVEYCAVTDRLYTGVERNEAGNGVLVVDPSTGEVERNIPTEAANCHWLAVSASGDRAYVSHKETEWVTVLDLETGETVAKIDAPGGAEEIDLSPDGRFAYFATPLLRMGPEVKDVGPCTIHKVDTATNEVVATVEVGPFISALSVGARHLAASQIAVEDPDGPFDGVVFLVNTDMMEIEAEIATGKGPFTSRFLDDRNQLLVTNIVSGTLTVVDLESHEIVSSFDNNPGTPWAGTHGLEIIPRYPA